MSIVDNRAERKTEGKSVPQGVMFSIHDKGKPVYYIKTTEVELIAPGEGVNCVNLTTGALDYKDGDCIVANGFLTLEG